jgi:hypothetical protein
VQGRDRAGLKKGKNKIVLERVTMISPSSRKPAGEHRVRNAAISHEVYHFAARQGMGAVMGSKNLKAVAVRGTTAPPYHDPRNLYEMTVTFHKKAIMKKVEDYPKFAFWHHTICRANISFHITDTTESHFISCKCRWLPKRNHRDEQYNP